MIEDVIKNLNDLYEATEQEHKDSQRTIQNNAKAVLGEIMDQVGYHYDLKGIVLRTNNWSNKKGIHIETTDNGYYGTNASFSQIRDKQEWANIDCNIRLSDSVSDERLIKNVAFSQMILAIVVKMRTDQELMNSLFDKMHKCFHSNEILEAKISLINHLIDKSKRTLDVIKIEDVLDKGHLKIESSKWTQTFGTHEKLIDEFKFVKNKTGTFTAELLSEGNLVSQSARASQQNITKIICTMLDIYNFNF